MAENKLFIVDASVLLKWFLHESEHQKQALILRDNFLKKRVSLAIPHYALAEILNIFGRKFSQEQAISAFSIFLNFKIDNYFISLELASIAISLMKSSPTLSFYDSCYHALALKTGGIFITADAKYYHAARKKKNILLLSDYDGLR